MPDRRSLLRGCAAAALTGWSSTMPDTAAAAPRVRRLVLVAGPPSHPTLMHEFHAGCRLLARCLEGMKELQVSVHPHGWPQDPEAFTGADAVVLYMDGGAKHPALQGDRLQLLSGLVARGVGLGCLHYAVEVPADVAGRQWSDWIGGHYEHLYSVNPMWEPDFQSLPKHAITRGVKPFRITDEWYFNMRFRPQMKGITPLLVARPSDDVRDGPYVYPKGPYDHIVAARGREEVLMWCVERPDGGRGLGFTGGHSHLAWGNDHYRKLVLNALLWLAKVKVPKDGVASTVSVEELYQHLDDKPGRPSSPVSP
jgi:hypothetical protein